MKYPENIDPPVTEFERRTGECPLFVALFILDEVRNYFWTDLPEDLADEVAQKAEIVFAGNTRWREKFQGRRGRAYLEMFMRHWLAAALFKRRSPLFRELPDSFKNGKQLPVISLFRQKEMGEAKTESRCLAKSRSRRKSRAAANSRPSSRFVHGTQVTKKG